MIAAGLVPRRSSARPWRDRAPGNLLLHVGEIRVGGQRRKRRRQLAGRHPRTLASGAASQPPLFSRYHVLVLESENTSQLVFTANDSDVPVSGASTGSPSNTTRLAGRG